MSAPFAHPNGLSAIAALIAAYAYANLLQRNRPTLGWGFAFLVGTIGTVLAAGRQGVAIWFLSIVVLSVAHQRLISLVVIIPALALGITGWWNEILMVLARGRPQSLTSLSGRIGWWQGALDVWSVHPWTGYGYGAGGRFVALSSLGHSATSSVHNGYLEALVGVGLLGFLPLLYVVGRNMRWSVERLRVRNETEIGILMIPLLLRTAVSLGFAGWLNQDVIMLVCLTALVDLDRRVQRTRSAAVHKPRGQLESQTATVN
jgi:O-antigen ligase